MITIIDYDAGNLKSICNMLDFIKEDYIISSDPKEIQTAKSIIFPGQGHFAQAMKNLKDKNLVEPIKMAIENNAKFLGICLGLQILFEKSEEAPGVAGLGIIKGECKKFTKNKIELHSLLDLNLKSRVGSPAHHPKADDALNATPYKIPQIGWNKIKTTQNNSYLNDDYFYFVNSYYVAPEDKNVISSTCDYGIEFCASIQYKNLTAVQFHPEKSSEAGIEFFKKWVKD